MIAGEVCRDRKAWRQILLFSLGHLCENPQGQFSVPKDRPPARKSNI